MPVNLLPLEVLEERWKRASSDYARTVGTHGSGSTAAREAWKCAKQALDAFVQSGSEEFKNDKVAVKAAKAVK